MAVTFTQLNQLYLAYFGRPVDYNGFIFFTNNPASTVDTVAAAFNSSPESQALFGGNAVAQVTAIYRNLFNRDPEVAGLTYWTGQIAKGIVSAPQAAIVILNAAVGTDATSVTNKLGAALSFFNAMDTVAEINGYAGTAAAASARSFLATVSDVAATIPTSAAVDAALATAIGTGSSNPGQSFNLTTAVDTLTGTTGNDTFTGQLGGTATLTALDSIDGGAGNDTLNINDVSAGTALPGGLTVKNVEIVNVAAANAATVDTSVGFTGVTQLNVTTSAGADVITAGAGQAVTVVDTNGTVTLTGGSTQGVTVSKGGFTLSKASGAVTVVDTEQSGVASTVNNGTTVNVTSSSVVAAAGTSGTITIGGTAAPTGAVTVVNNVTGDKTGNTTGGAIAVTGGTTVSVTENATQPILTTAGANATVQQGAVTVTGTSTTTTVSVTESAAATAAATVLAAAAVTETGTVQFAALAAGATIILGGLTYTAPAGGATAKQVAAAFANLSGGLTGWTTGAVTGTGSDTVVFTSTAAGNVADLANTGTGALAAAIVEVQGVAAATAAGKGGIALGAVTVNDAQAGTANAGTIANVTLNNYGNSTISSNALTSVGLAGKSGTLGITNNIQTSLDMTVNKLSGANTITDASGKYTTLKIHTSGADSTIAGLAFGAATALTVDGSNALALTATGGLAALKTVTVSGAAGVSGDFSAATVTDVNASATTGNMTVTIDGTKATYEGGAGNDAVTIVAAPTKAISGGAGVDTLVVNVAAATFSNPSGNAFISGFETLGLGAAADGAYDATGFAHLTEGAVTNAVSFVNVAAGVDLNITATPGFGTTYTLKDATGTTDVLALNVVGSGAIAANTVTAAGIETVNITATDTATTAVAGGTADSLTLADAAAKAITILGNTTLTFSQNSTKVTSVDASGMTGGLTYTTAGTTAEVVKGGATANQLTAGVGTQADTLIGGAKGDTLTANAGQDTLTGGAGSDNFVVQTLTANVNTYSTITDATAGDILVLKDVGVETFTATKVSLAATAVFQDYANAVVAAAGNAAVNGAIGWFQFGGDTYVVESLHNGATTPSFVNGTDLIVKLAGTVDLSTAQLLSGATGVPGLALH